MRGPRFPGAAATPRLPHRADSATNRPKIGYAGATPRGARGHGQKTERMIILHHLNDSRSQRILWLLEELGLEYRVEKYLRDPATLRAPPGLRALHPLGKLPVIVDGDLVLAESGAIVEYVLERYGEGRLVPPAGTPERLRYLYWMHYAEGSAMTPLLVKFIFDRIETGPVPFFLRPVVRGLARAVKGKFAQPEIECHLDFLEASLGDSTWFAGEALTGADILLSFPLQVAAAQAGLDARRPRLVAFLQRVAARPAWQRGVERGGPYGL
jgi:glutathione S-transferase